MVELWVSTGNNGNISSKYMKSPDRAPFYKKDFSCRIKKLDMEALFQSGISTPCKSHIFAKTPTAPHCNHGCNFGTNIQYNNVIRM